MVWVSSRQEACWPLRFLLSVIKAQRTVMTRIDVGLPGSLHDSALPPCQHLSESPPSLSASTLKTDASRATRRKEWRMTLPGLWDARLLGEQERGSLPSEKISRARRMHACTTAEHHARLSFRTVCSQAINN